MEIAAYCIVGGLVLIVIVVSVLTYRVIRCKKQEEDAYNIVKELRLQLGQEQANVSSLNQRVAELTQVQKELEETQEQLQQEQANVSSLNQRVAELTQVQKELEETQEQLQQAQANASVLNQRVAELTHVQKELEEAQEQLQQAQANVSSLNQRIAALTHVQKELEETQEQLQQAQTNVSALNQRVADLIHVQDELADAQVKIQNQNEKITDLERQVSQLLQDVEDLEDDLADKEKEVTRLRTKISAFEQENLTLASEKSCLQRSYDELEKKHITTTEELQSKGQTLTFVDEILGAQLSSDGQELNTTIDRLADFICEEIVSSVKKIVSKNQQGEVLSYLNRVRNWAVSSKKTWIGDKTTIAFVGEFSAGKTSIVNRILSQDQANQALLPVDTKATTAIPTYISGGRESRFQFYTPDNKLKKISEQSFRRVTKDMLENIKGISSLISYFVMKYNNPNLDKISILDTPGFCSLDDEDTRRTIDVINECDALFWVFDVNLGALGNEVISKMFHVVKQHLSCPLYIIINKTDTKSKSEVDAVEKDIIKGLEKHKIPAKGIIRFSSNKTLHPLSLILKPIAEVKHDKTKDSILEEIEKLLKETVADLMAEFNQCQATYTTKKQSRERIRYNYGVLHRNMTSQCETASTLPQFIDHIILTDYYKLTIADYNKLSSIMSDITNSNERMNELFQNNGEIVSEMEQLDIKLRELNQKVVLVQQLLEKFRILRKSYQNAYEKTKIGHKPKK